jgi:Raf kinase inhibitor-like YbhB/YbcL family protein
MRRWILARPGVVRLFAAGAVALGALFSTSPPVARAQSAEAMQVTSASFKDGDYLPMDHILSASFGFGCSGGNISPQLAWSGAPDGTKSFAVTAFDPDAPTGSGFWHWLVVNIPPTVSELAPDVGNPSAGKLPSGALQTRTDFGKPGYGGPCPPEGDHPHRYLFTVYAVGVDQLQGVNADTSAAVIGFMLHFNTLDKAELMGLYKH